jgi:hypothetical protein
MKPAFTAAELKRVGTAATMLVVCGTIVILAMTMVLGHYNSLAHSGPKAVLDGAVIGLLMGRRGRWRCLTLLGTVYGLVLLLQVGVFYLLPVTMLAAALAAVAGRAVDVVHRGAALVVAAVVYELLAGCGAPIKIHFGTGGSNEPFIWGLWFAEFPFRVAGATIGVWLAMRWQQRGSRMSREPLAALPAAPLARTAGANRTRGVAGASLRVSACLLACVLPMRIESPLALGVIALGYLIYALCCNVGWRALHAIIGLVGGWLVFAALSYAWHRETDRVLDLSRTLVLRFAPLTLASIVLVTTVRAVDMIRLLRRGRISGVVILPFAAVVRGVSHSRRSIRQAIESLRAGGLWTGPASLLRHPILITRSLLAPHVRRWADELVEERA